jgi:hypothetical protein
LQHTPSIVKRSSHIAIATSNMLGIWKRSAGTMMQKNSAKAYAYPEG